MFHCCFGRAEKERPVECTCVAVSSAVTSRRASVCISGRHAGLAHFELSLPYGRFAGCLAAKHGESTLIGDAFIASLLFAMLLLAVFRCVPVNLSIHWRANCKICRFNETSLPFSTVRAPAFGLALATAKRSLWRKVKGSGNEAKFCFSGR